MQFNDLDEKQKNELSVVLNRHAQSLGSVNALLTLIEDLRKRDTIALVSKEKRSSFSVGSISWNKFIYKDTFDLLVNSIIKEDKNEELKPKEKKNILNMLKTVKPVVIKIKPKNQKTGEGFSFSILDEDSKISLLFKIIFIYHMDFAKKALKWDVKS